MKPAKKIPMVRKKKNREVEDDEVDSDVDKEDENSRRKNKTNLKNLPKLLSTKTKKPMAVAGSDARHPIHLQLEIRELKFRQ